MSGISPPEQRVCQRCGRADVWDDDRGAWRIRGTGEGGRHRESGEQYCVHEWDISGRYNPVERA